MKLGVAYNFFDCEELLEASVLNIRPLVDYIVIIFQEVSNHGNPCTQEAKEVVEKLRQYVDDVVVYTPQLTIPPNHNETAKRNLGLDMCRKNGCTHHLAMDADEFYDREQFLASKQVCVNYDSTACHIYAYIKTPEYRKKDPEIYDVPFIFKITPGSKFVLGNTFPVYTDPTRAPNPTGNFYKFSLSSLVMHHLTWVRKDMSSKIRNSSSRINYTEQSYKTCVKDFATWTPEKPGIYPGGNGIVKVKNMFNVDGEFNVLTPLSIIMPCEENRLPLFKNTIERYASFKDSWKNIELIIISRTIKPDQLKALKETIANKTKLINYIFPGDTINPSKAFNLGIRNSDYNSCIITCPEVLPRTDVIKQLRKQGNSNIVCRVIDLEQDGREGITLVSSSFRGSTPGMYFLAMFQKDDILKINGWDEQFMSGMAYEDVDFGDRFCRAGLSFKVCDDIVALHQYHERNPRNERWEINRKIYENNTAKGITAVAKGICK